MAMTVVVTLAACSSAPSKPHPGALRLELYIVEDLLSGRPGSAADFERDAKGAVGDVPWDGETGWALVVQNGLLILRADEAAQASVQSYIEVERSKVDSRRK